MADAVTTQILIDGPRNVVMRFTNVSDGTGEAVVVKVTPANLSGAPTAVKLMRAKGTAKGMGVSLFWKATTNVPLWHFPIDMDVDQDFTKFGGITNNAAPARTTPSS